MSTTVYTYNDRLVGVGNDQILGTSQGGGASYTAGDYISIDNNEISVTGISAGDGTLSIVQNVTGAPLNIIYPTDVAPLSETYNLTNNIEGTDSPYSTSLYIAYRSPGYAEGYYTNSTDSIVLDIPAAVTGVAYISLMYTNESSKYGSGPTAAATLTFTGPEYTVQPGKYVVRMQYNTSDISYGYGKYITALFSGPGPDATKAALINAYIAAPDPSLGIDVNLDRYYLGGNIVGTKPTNSGLPAQIWLNPETNKQEVYLPNSVPGSWNLYGNTFYNYTTSTPYSLSGGSASNCIAYKYDSANAKYIYARMTSSDSTNKKSEFVTLEPVSGKFEKWTYDWSNYSNRHWTTETIEIGGGSTYTAGDYISIENDEIAVTGVGNLVAGNNITITESGNNITISSEGGGSTYTAGQYISIDGNDVIAVTGLAPVSGSDGIAVNDNVVSLDTPVEIVAGENITISVTGASAIFSAQGGTSYTEGNCIDITSNAISWETTAGITDIVSVTALPANPVATVIYLIPET